MKLWMKRLDGKKLGELSFKGILTNKRFKIITERRKSFKNKQ